MRPSILLPHRIALTRPPQLRCATTALKSLSSLTRNPARGQLRSSPPSGSHLPTTSSAFTSPSFNRYFSTSTPSMVQVCFLGLGNMGGGMAANLATKASLDAPLIIWNRSDAKYAAFEGKPVTIAASLDEAVAKSDIIFSCVSNDAAISELYEAALKIPDGVAGKVFAECSTIHPDTTRKLQSLANGAGAEFVAAPVFGAPAMAAAGALVFVLAGSKDGIAKITPYLDGVMGRLTIDLSDNADVGTALKLKVIGNTVILGMVESLSEGHVLSEKSGLGTANFEKFITAMFGMSPYLPYSKRLTTGDYVRDKPLFSADLALKDANHALSLAKEAGTTMPIVEIAAKHLVEAKEEVGSKSDIASIYGSVRKNAGLPF
ncbi:uncharacterized protein V1518DRAFT_414416 [Limtongia smithiae]|uniref:uncharacterized protein n=1 Tax=Limtongia smithiae TaxID=1125753 RepID=UPI0034CE1926